MNKISLLLFTLLTFCFGLGSPTVAMSQTVTERDYNVQGEWAPFTVELYADALLTPSPRGTVPQGRQPEGWCCRGGEVFQGLPRYCEEIGGIPFQTPEEAHRHCTVVSDRQKGRSSSEPEQGAIHMEEGQHEESLDATPITLP